MVAFIIINALVVLKTIDAFHFPVISPSCYSRLYHTSSPLTLFGVSPEHQDFDCNGDICDVSSSSSDSFNLETARLELESLFITSDSKSGRTSRQSTPGIFAAGQGKQLTPAPPLTTIQRERREHEIYLLGQLAEGDEVLPELWTLWFYERGPQAANQLLKVEELTRQETPSGRTKAKLILQELIKEHGFHFTEPVNRLAILYYEQGLFREAIKLWKTVLVNKPWHFGALSGIVSAYAEDHEPTCAQQWAPRRLPSFQQDGPNRRRLSWVKNAAKEARDNLASAELRIIKAFGDPDSESNTNSDLHFYETEKKLDAWQ